MSEIQHPNTYTVSEEKKEIIFKYLDILRSSGLTNMFAAGSYIRGQFDVDKQEAKELLIEWMQTFAERHKDNLGVV